MRIEADPFERHFSPKTIAELWGFSEQTIVRIFQSEPGVLMHGDENPRGKQRHVSIRIPESVMKRVYRERIKAAA